MRKRIRSIVLAGAAAAIVAFLAVQDALAVAGAREYAARQRAAAAGRGPAVTIDEVMKPALRRSVRAGALAGAGVFAVGLGVAFSAARRPGVPGADRGPSRR